MKCRATPYQGQEPFAFFSYCHKDSDRVYPLIEELTELGYRIWFDEGIGIGDEWPEVIARKLEECNTFLVAMTPNYCCSHNCKNEMTYQVEDQKPMLPLMMEDFPLSGGIKLQLAGTQYLRLFDRSPADWAGLITNSGMLAACKGAPLSLLPKTEEPPKVKEPPKTEEPPKTKEPPKTEEPPKVEEPPKIEEPPKTPEPPETPEPPMLKEPPESKDLQQTEGEEIFAVCLETGKLLFGRQGRVVLTPGQQEPGPRVQMQEGFFLVENLGHTAFTVEGITVEPGQTVQPACGSPIYTDTGSYLPLLQSEAKQLRGLGCLRYLQADKTGEVRLIGTEPMLLGRKNPWHQNVLSDHRISRRHAEILPDGDSGKVFLKDCSKNGTFVNDQQIPDVVELADGNRLAIGDAEFHYCLRPLDTGDEEREQSYDQVLLLLEQEQTPENIAQAERLLSQLGDFRDCGRLQLQCKQKLEAIRQEQLRQQEELYCQAQADLKSGDYAQAQEKLEQLQDYRDAGELLKKCAELAAEAEERTYIDKAADEYEKTICNTVKLPPKELLLLVDLATGQVFRGKYQSTVIGRKFNQCDIAFPDNGCMSRRHAELFTLKGKHYLRDCNSSNGTRLNGQALERGQTQEIGDSALLNLAGTQLLVAYDQYAAWLQKQENVTYLESTVQEMPVVGGKTRYAFQVEDLDATVCEGETARRCCGEFWQDGDGAWLEPRYDNDVFLNGQMQKAGKPIQLKDGDHLRIGDADYRFRSVHMVFL